MKTTDQSEPWYKIEIGFNLKFFMFCAILGFAQGFFRGLIEALF